MSCVCMLDSYTESTDVVHDNMQLKGKWQLDSIYTGLQEATGRNVLVIMSLFEVCS